jgi:hypothetical protein
VLSYSVGCVGRVAHLSLLGITKAWDNVNSGTRWEEVKIQETVSRHVEVRRRVAILSPKWEGGRHCLHLGRLRGPRRSGIGLLTSAKFCLLFGTLWHQSRCPKINFI